MTEKIKRNSGEYQLAERIVHLQAALDMANQELNKEGKLGVLPSRSTSFRKANAFHKKVRNVLGEIYF